MRKNTGGNRFNQLFAKRYADLLEYLGSGFPLALFMISNLT